MAETVRGRHPFSTRHFATALVDDQRNVQEVSPWETYVLLRSIPGTSLYDATGGYPFLPFGADADFHRGLECLRKTGAISLVFVTDPLHPPPESVQSLELCRKYKAHYVFDRSLAPLARTRRNWREVRIAQRSLRIEEVSYVAHVEVFSGLYDNLVRKHEIVGAAAFDMGFFKRIAGLPGLRAIAAWHGPTLVSMMLFVTSGQTAYSFLAGTTDEGRKHCAHYGIYAMAIESFSEIDIINFGGVPGMVDEATHGIAHVKRKLSNSIRHSYLCGAILNEESYRALCVSNSTDAADSQWFPAYRFASN